MRHRPRLTISARTAPLIAVHIILVLAQFAGAQDVPTNPTPEEGIDAITKKTVAARLLAEMGPNTPIDTKVGRLIDRLVLRDHDQVQAAVIALTLLGRPAVPAIIRRIDDRRDMPARFIAFENRSVDAFEGVRHYAPFKVVDCLGHVLDDITGESFGSVGAGAVGIRDKDRPGCDAERSEMVAGWRGYLARRNAAPPVPAKSLPVTSGPFPR